VISYKDIALYIFLTVAKRL